MLGWCGNVGVAFGLLLLSLGVAHAQAPDVSSHAVARVKLVRGDAQLINRSPPATLKVGDTLFIGDIVATRSGALGFTMEDGTRIALGANAKLQIQRFAYQPAEGNLALVLRFLAGPIRYASGVIARLAPDKVQIETPTATVAVRGTTFAATIRE